MDALPDTAEAVAHVQKYFPLPPGVSLADMAIAGAQFKAFTDAALGDFIIRLVYWASEHP
ncbi:MAG: hypothetical protein KGR26_08760 [Cyanobacteria bacterium REEB65]|nr:hypothetical protein [Cyanobacteria bacterium REEB65]